MSEALDSGRGPGVDGGGDARTTDRPAVAPVPTAKPKRFLPGALANGDGPRCQLEPLPDDWGPRSVTEVVESCKTGRWLDDDVWRAASASAGYAALILDLVDDNGPSDGPRCLPGGAGGMVEGEHLRGERELARAGPGLPRRSWYLSRQLDRVRRSARLRRGMGGIA